MNTYELLEAKQKKRIRFEQKDEHLFFMKNREILNKFPRFAFLYDSEGNDFDVIRANIIILAYQNKIAIEEEIANVGHYINKDVKTEHLRFVTAVKERTIELPYLTFNKSKIYIPFFSLALNLIYSKEPEKMLAYPYNELGENYVDSAIDPFDTYGTALFDSFFTKLVKIGTNGKEVAFFHYDTNTIYIVNTQGRLDCKIVLFDKYIKRPDYSHMLERLKPVVDAYFINSRDEFITSLHKSGFISDHMYAMIKYPSNY